MNEPQDQPHAAEPDATRPLPGSAAQRDDRQQPSRADETLVDQQAPAEQAGPVPPSVLPDAPPPSAGPGGFRRFVGHRATQLVAVGVLGLVLGGGIVGVAGGFVDHEGADHQGAGHQRPGHSRHVDGHGGHGDFRGHGESRGDRPPPG